jgi:hypothetical protein
MPAAARTTSSPATLVACCICVCGTQHTYGETSHDSLSCQIELKISYFDIISLSTKKGGNRIASMADINKNDTNIIIDYPIEPCLHAILREI